MMEIDISDYYSYDEVKSIVKSSIESEARHQVNFKKDLDFERIFNNSAYHIVFTEMDNAVDYDVKELIKSKVLNILNSNSEFGLYRRKSDWEKEDSKAYTYLQEYVEQHKGIIESKVISQLENIDSQYIIDLINESVYNILDERLRGNE